MFKKHKGFTLAEILIVVALLGTLMTVLMISVGAYFDKTRETGVRNDFNNMKTAIETVMRENSGLPKKSGASSGTNVWDKKKDAAASFNKTVNLINDCLDPNMKLVDGNDEDGNGYVVSGAVEGKEPRFTGLTNYAESGSPRVTEVTPEEFGTWSSGTTMVNGEGKKDKKIIVTTKTDPWGYNYSFYFQRRNEPDTLRNSDGDRIGRLDKVLITSWGCNGTEREAQYAMLIEYDNGTITIAQTGFQGENVNTIEVGVIDQPNASGRSRLIEAPRPATSEAVGYFIANKSTIVDKDNAVGKGYTSAVDSVDNNGNIQNSAYTEKPVRNLIYGSIINPDDIIARDINNYGNADLSQFDAQAFNS